MTKIAELEDQIAKVLSDALNHSNAYQTEALAYAHDSALTRFSNLSIHQNVVEKNVHLSIRIIKDKRIGYASTNRLDKKSVQHTVNLALEIAKERPEDTEFKSLPTPKSIIEMSSFVPATAECSPKQRAAIIKLIIDKASKNKLSAAGAFSTEAAVLGVANSLGIKSIHSLTQASLNTVVSSASSSGFASFISKDVSELDPEAFADRAIKKALLSKNPVGIEPGKYDVILEEEAVAELISFLAFIGFGALAYQEQRSFLCGKIGQEIVAKNITIWDDALDSRTIGFPFDFEGVPKQKVVLIEDGMAKNVVYDSYTAQKEGKESTGHALPAPNPYGPIPTNLFLKEGDSSIDEMISLTKKGILISRFHYTNVEDPIRTILTGMTRDGTFLIENGTVVRGVKNLRITQNILEALANVESISQNSSLIDTGFGACNVPALKVRDFNFTGVTEF
jgi:predicted Zn-dependent protease